MATYHFRVLIIGSDLDLRLFERDFVAYMTAPIRRRTQKEHIYVFVPGVVKPIWSRFPQQPGVTISPFRLLGVWLVGVHLSGPAVSQIINKIRDLPDDVYAYPAGTVELLKPIVDPVRRCF